MMLRAKLGQFDWLFALTSGLRIVEQISFLFVWLYIIAYVFPPILTKMAISGDSITPFVVTVALIFTIIRITFGLPQPRRKRTDAHA